MTASMHHGERVSLLANQKAISSDAEQMIANSWRRCLSKHQLDPDVAPRVQVLETQQLRERSQRHDYLMGVSQQELVDLYNQLQGSGFNIFLTDAEGIILQQVCDPVYAPALRRAGAHLGADWSEPNSGTNGVGTCIYEQRPVAVHLEDHFHTKHTGLSCSAAPIRDPGGELLAVLDCSTASIKAPCVDKHILGLVRNSATFIEGLYFLRLHRSDLIIHLGINPDIVPQPRNAMIAVTPSGQITGANERALLALGIPSRLNLLGRDISHLLDLRKQPLSARAAGQIHQIKLIDRGTQVFATWQVPAPISTESYDNRAPLSELSPLAKPEPDRLCWGDITLDEQVIAASKIYNQRVNVLLQGETGTGKDTLARELHDASCLKNGLFVTIDCSASSSDELSNLFTDSEERLNQSLYPEGGSLFLNNIHQLNSEGQSQALALLQRLERCSLDHKRGFQAISASRTCLYEAVEKQLFKEDLYYRLAPFVVDLAPLRDRDSLETLISKLLQAENTRAMHQCALSKPALEALAQHPWQGNTRELQNTLRTLVILNRNGTIEVSDLPKIMQFNAGTSAEQADKPCWTGLEAAEYSALLEALRDHNWNISATAKTLSMSRNTLYRRMEKYGIQVETSDMAGH